MQNQREKENNKRANKRIKSDTSIHCHFWIKGKQRFCRFDVNESKSYCNQHDPESIRIPCPLDPKHTIPKNKLQTHMKKCNLQPMTRFEYYSKDINKGNHSSKNHEKQSLHSIGKQGISSIIKKIENAYMDYTIHYGEIKPIYNKNNHEKDYVPIHKKQEKHSVQMSNILNHIKSKELLKDPLNYIEFGSGKGQLTNKASEITNKDSHFFLIDRHNFRNKHDKKMDSNKTRIQMDIKDLMLDLVPGLVDLPVVCLSKHLCGVATDFTLRCLEKLDCLGVFVALCCHHCCEYADFINPNALEKYGIREDEFGIVTMLSSWYVCQSHICKDITNTNGDDINLKDGNGSDDCNGDSDDDSNEAHIDIKTLDDALNTDINDEHWSGLSLSERISLGFKCKRILDWARVDYLTEKGFKSNLVYYCEQSVTPENVMLVAIKHKTK